MRRRGHLANAGDALRSRVSPTPLILSKQSLSRAAWSALSHGAV